MATQRLFFAINLDAQTRLEINQSVLSRIPANGFARTRTENLHMTLLFLGSQPADQLSRLVEHASTCVSFGAFEAEFKRIGHFNSNILWLGTGRGTREFEELAGCLRRALHWQDQRLHPHITLARAKGIAKNEFQDIASELNTVNYSARVQIKGFDLMASKLTSRGPEYTCLQSFVFEAEP